jgi:hypothetical protein
MRFQTIRNCLPILAFSGLALSTAGAANPALNTVVGRTIYHSDNTRTESVRDPNTRELTEMTYNPNNILMVRKVFLLNEKGEPTAGNIYDGRGNLVARSISVYDDLGRRSEDRLINLKGEVFQRVVHEYGADGKPKQPKVINLDVAAPSIKPGLIDFTQTPSLPQPATTPSGRFAPDQAPGAAAGDPIYAPGAGPAGAVPEKQPEQKPSFLKRLFKKDKK